EDGFYAAHSIGVCKGDSANVEGTRCIAATDGDGRVHWRAGFRCNYTTCPGVCYCTTLRGHREGHREPEPAGSEKLRRLCGRLAACGLALSHISLTRRQTASGKEDLPGLLLPRLGLEVVQRLLELVLEVAGQLLLLRQSVAKTREAG